MNQKGKDHPAEFVVQQGGLACPFWVISLENGHNLSIIPTRSCQKFSKQICLWDLAQTIGILFIIQIVEAI